MKKLFLSAALLLGSLISLSAQSTEKIPTPGGLPTSYPRIHITEDEKPELLNTIATEKWAQGVKDGIHKKVDKYVEQHVTDPTWMPSRLQMHWKTKSSNIYIKGITYSHADGEAPVPTVRFAGSRDGTTPYGFPDLEDVLPYMDDERGLYMQNRSKEGKPMEWVSQSKTGTSIPNFNIRIVNFARDAAFLYWLEGDERYAKFAFDIFDVYMQGMYYRSEPIDLDNGHIQTLVGLECFQVIHEKTLKSVSEIYDFLHAYLESNHKEKMDNYIVTIKKWIDQIIKNGVPQNNWNLHQANIILKAAMVLEDDDAYADKKGRQYYIDYMLNVTSPRQWSMTKLLDYGYDPTNGIWAECPGYSQGVTKEVMAFIADYDVAFDFDLMPYLPVMEQAVRILPQYLFPNGETVAFGDSNYGHLEGASMRDIVRLAQKSGDKELEEEFTAMYRLFDPTAENVQDNSKPRAADISSFFASKPVEINKKYAAGKVSDYVTQTFYAPTVSWHVQRMGEGKDGMMVSLNGSLGNHMHANGINMELYGKGLVQGADPGKGANYLQAAYLEYYSQFPAHNTVMVDGVSSYTEMLSYHAFDLDGAYPKSEQKDGFYPNITYSNVSFLEPETQSDQNRTVSIVRTGETTGYYVDIFRSKKKRGNDRFHDYYYHNLGQTMEIQDAKGNPMELTAEEKIGFAGGHLYALDYMWDEKFAATSDDYQVEWKIDYPDGKEDILMNLWMKGNDDREIFSILSPPCKSFKSNSQFPYEVSESPYLTFIARQHGEAWDNPFISIYEPYTSTEGKSIESITGFDDENGDKSFAGVALVHKSGRKDFVLSSYDLKMAKYQNMESNGAYALIGITSSSDFELFMGNGTKLQYGDYKIEAEQVGNVVVKSEGGKLTMDNEVPVTLTINGKSKKFAAGELRAIKGL
ncbi:MAG: hypothetical protein SNG02_01595 [Rikenellaceae bacterium]